MCLKIKFKKNIININRNNKKLEECVCECFRENDKNVENKMVNKGSSFIYLVDEIVPRLESGTLYWWSPTASGSGSIRKHLGAMVRFSINIC